MNQYLLWHQLKYPLMTTDDIIKLLFQAEFAGGHMITSKSDVLKYLYHEITQLTKADDAPLYEPINSQYVRVHLYPYLKYHLPLYDLCEAFIQSANHNMGNIDNFNKSLNDSNILSSIPSQPHHSAVYRNNYHPHYRVIEKKYISHTMQFAQAHHFLSQQKGFKIIAIEGKCGSGKSTLANHLSTQLPITVIPIDDFFLPPNKRTNERLDEIGGNIDYERIQSVLARIKPNQELTYQAFQCDTNNYQDKTIYIKDLVLLEGVYSFHSNFRNHINKVIFVDVDEETQYKRIQTRVLADKFFNEWIPLENQYYQHQSILAHASIII